MDTAPAEYLSLNNTGGNYNYSQYTAGGALYGSNVVTHYTKVRFNPDDVKIDSKDRTFSTNNGGYIPSWNLSALNYGEAGACINLNVAGGVANLDITGTLS